MYPSQPPQQPYPQPDPNQQGYAQSPYGQPPYAPQPGGEAYGMPPNPYAPPSTPMQPPYAAPSTPLQQPNPYANPYAPPSVPLQQQQPMYGAPAPMAAPNTLNFNLFTLPQNRGNLFAAAGGIVALISFFVLPYYGISAGTLGSVSVSGTQMTDGTYGGSGLLWLVPLAAVVAVVVGCLVTLGIRSIQGLTPRNAAYAVLGSGGVGTLICLFTLLQVNNQISQAQASSGISLASAGVSYGFSFGFWLTLLAMIVVAVGGILNLRQTQPAYTPPPPYMGGYPPQNPPM